MGLQPRRLGCLGGIIAITPTAKSAQRPGWSLRSPGTMWEEPRLGISDDAPRVSATKDHERALALTLASKIRLARNIGRESSRAVSGDGASSVLGLRNQDHQGAFIIRNVNGEDESC